MKFDSLIILLSLFAAPVLGSMASAPHTGDPVSETPTHVVILGEEAQVEGFPADAVYEEGPMVNGQRNGSWTRYHVNGQVRSEIHYADNVPYGDYRLYTDDGQLFEEGRWEHGVNVGHLRRYWPNGTIQQLLTFDKMGVGQGQQRYFHDNGQLEMLVELADGQEQGDLVRLDREGRVVKRTTYDSGRIVQRAY